jgi:Methyltransferase FkbM domain
MTTAATSLSRTKRLPRGGSGLLVASIVLVLGFLLGHFHAQLTRAARHNTMAIVQQQHQPQRMIAEPQVEKSRMQRNSVSDGWHSIEVFYGDRDRLETYMIPDGEATTFAQANQDYVILALLRNKTGGYFIDLASNDATILSNTYRLERYHGWKGICMEPNPIYWSNLTSLRRCSVVGAVVGNEERMHEVYFRFDAKIQGGITGAAFDNGIQFRGVSVPKYTVPLAEVLQRFQAPKYIDYLSLDVEGAEEYILQHFSTWQPKDGYTIALMTVERPKRTLEKLLESRGYVMLRKVTHWGETLWAHSSVVPTLDTDAMEAILTKAAIKAKADARAKRNANIQSDLADT